MIEEKVIGVIEWVIDIKHIYGSLNRLVVVLKDTTIIFWSKTIKVNYTGIERVSALGDRDLVK